MKKILFTLIGVFLVSGCSATYEVELYNETVKEKLVVESVEIDIDKKSEWEIPVYYNETLVTDIKSNTKINDVTYYNKEQTVENNLNKYIYSHDFKLKGYYTSRIPNTAYQYFGVFYDDYNEEEKINLITISTSFNCKIFDEYKELEKVKVILKSNYKMYKNNADETETNTYIWNITRENYSNKSIYISFYKDEKFFNYNNNFQKYLYFWLGIAFIVGIVILIFSKKLIKVNKI